MAVHETHLLDVRLIRCGVVYDQEILCFLDQRGGFLPECHWAWRQSCQEVRVGIVQYRQSTAGGFGAGVNILRDDEKLDVIQVCDLRCVNDTKCERIDLRKLTQNAHCITSILKRILITLCIISL